MNYSKKILVFCYLFWVFFIIYSCILISKNVGSVLGLEGIAFSIYYFLPTGIVSTLILFLGISLWKKPIYHVIASAIIIMLIIFVAYDSGMFLWF